MNITHRMVPQTRVVEIEFNRDDVLKAIKQHQIDNLAEIAGFLNTRTNQQQAEVFYNLLTNNQEWFDAVVESTSVPWIDTPKTDEECASVIEEFPWIFFTDNTSPYLGKYLPTVPSQLEVKYAYFYNTYKQVLDSDKILRNLGIKEMVHPPTAHPLE